MMNFNREVTRQNSCYTYVIEDDDLALASLNVFKVKATSNCMNKNKYINTDINVFHMVNGQIGLTQCLTKGILRSNLSM